VRFLYGVTLERNTDQLMASVPRMKHSIRRAEIYARSEVEAILSAPRQPRDRAFLMTVYACGLRLAEARHLKTTDIDRARMQLLGTQGQQGARLAIKYFIGSAHRHESITPNIPELGIPENKVRLALGPPSVGRGRIRRQVHARP
jgi:integrase